MNYFDGWSELTRRVIEGTHREQEVAVCQMDERFTTDAKANLFAIRQKVERLEKESGDGHKE